jgi:hypothetical protein
MKIGGNGNAQSFFRKHGMSNMHVKIEKKYTSKAANAYKAELAKLVEIEASKRGEGQTPNDTEAAGSLLANLDLSDQGASELEARRKLEAARSAQTAVPQAKLASTMPGASRLVVTPPSSGNAPKLVLRKPAGSAGGMGMLKKKPAAAGASKLRVNKIVTPGSTSTDGFDTFEKPAEPEAQDTTEAAANGTANGTAAPSAIPLPAPPAAVPVLEPVLPPKSAQNQQFDMKKGVDQLKMMNSDFFSGF